jgi:hypothetical protein
MPSLFGGLTVSGPDPFAAATAALNFASTPVGQEVVEDIRTVDKFIIQKLGQLILLLHGHAVKDVPSAAVAPLITPATVEPAK